MREPRLIGRVEECRKLERCLDRREAQLIVVRGRRRVGKTFLINHFFENGFDFKLTGEYKASKAEQLENFVMELNRRTHTKHPTPESWKDAFEMLRAYLSTLPEGEKHIAFFDEMPWMDTPKSGFLKAFEYFWNITEVQRKTLFLLFADPRRPGLRSILNITKAACSTEKPAAFFFSRSA